MLREIAPQVRGSAVIDDRSLQGPEDQINTALCAIFVFDKRAGHLTHPEKITFASPSSSVRKRVCTWTYDGLKPRFEQTQKLVGDVITILKNGASALPNARLEHGIRSAARIKFLDCSKAAKSHAMATVAVPRITPSTLWTKPLASRLNTFRTMLIGNIFGKSRSGRCPEIGVTVCVNPLKNDPISILLTRTMMDARRLLRKSSQRLN